MSRVKSAAINTALVVASLAVGLVLCEATLRVRAYFKYAVQADYTVWGRDVPFTQIPSGVPGNLYGSSGQGSHTLSLYDGAGVMRQRNHVSINNYGWYSKRDYAVAKSPDEFRIALLGDSMTGTATNARIWADTLEDLLNADRAMLAAVGKKRITVLNFGVPGAGLEYMYYPEAHIAYRFSPDLVIVNFITDDLLRLALQAQDVAEDPRTEPVMHAPPPLIPLRYLEYGDIRVPISCSGATTLRATTDCTALPFWQIGRGTTVPQDEMQRVKRAVAKELIWRRIILSRKWLLEDLFVARAAAQEVDTTDYIGRSIKALEAIRRLQPRVLLAHMPTFDHLTEGHLKEMLAQFERAAAAAGFTVKRADRRMPIQHDESVIRRWFNLPHDGHWSDEGADLYAAAVHRLLRDEFLSGKQAPPDDGGCAPAFSRFEEASVKAEAGQTREALAALTSAVALLPSDVEQRFAAATAYSDCGFAATLYRRSVDALLAAGDLDAADRALTKGLALEPDSIGFLVAASEVAVARGRADDVFDRMWKRAAAIPEPEERVGLLLSSGGLAVKARNYREAERAHREVLVIRPNHLPALEGVAAALLGLGRPQDAIGQLNAALAQAPNRAELLLLRARAFVAVEQRENALADLSRIAPSNGEAEAVRTAAAALRPGAAAPAASTSAAAPTVDRADPLLRSGELAAKAGKHAEAERAYREVLVIRPNHLPALHGLAATLLSLGRPSDAIGQLNAAVAQAPNRADLLLLRARAFVAVNQPENALADLARIAPSNKEAAALRTSLKAR